MTDTKTERAANTRRADTYLSWQLRRPRRNRQSEALRSMVRETHLTAKDFILPLFVREGEGQRDAIDSMPDVFRLTPDLVLREAEKAFKMGIPAVILFAFVSPDKKDAKGSEAYRSDNVVNETVKLLKRELPELCVMVDIALDPYTDHGHDGVLCPKGRILNDPSCEVLGKMTLAAAEAGADFVAPSDMMDGRVGYLRRLLDSHNFQDVGILSYTVKYTSACYAPFRDALQSAPKIGDKKTYQMDPANVREALIEAKLDEDEGADMLMVKPAGLYLDVIAKMRQQTELPIAAFHVSGEYSMVKAAAQLGWIDGDRMMHEALLGIKRAGADIILSYAAPQIVPLLG